MVTHIGVGNNYTIYYPHPVTIKRWMKTLLENPRIGPKLRARMNG